MKMTWNQALEHAKSSLATFPDNYEPEFVEEIADEMAAINTYDYKTLREEMEILAETLDTRAPIIKQIMLGAWK